MVPLYHSLFPLHGHPAMVWRDKMIFVMAVRQTVNKLNISQRGNLFIWFVPKSDLMSGIKTWHLPGIISESYKKFFQSERCLLVCWYIVFPDRLKTQNFRLKSKLQFRCLTRKTANMLLITSLFHSVVDI